MTALDRYVALSGELIAARARAGHNDAIEDALLDKLDVEWYAMSEAERKQAREATRELVRGAP